MIISRFMKNCSYAGISLILLLLLLSACKKTEPVVTVETLEVLSVTDSSAKVSLRVTGENAAGHSGIFVSKSPSPTVDNTDNLIGHGGSGSGTFTADVTKLEDNTHYYARAFCQKAAYPQPTPTGPVWVYGHDLEFTTPPQSVPQIHFNGTILYVYPKDLKPVQGWSLPPYGFIGADSPTDGRQNTALLQAYSSAAQKCADLDGYGYSDWYLPSKEELDAIYQNRHLIRNLEGPDVYSYYWSSTEYDQGSVFAQNFHDGVSSLMTKNSSINCRCIRR